jgi:hypothetical protein
MTQQDRLEIDITRWKRLALVVGSAALLLTLAGVFISRDQFFRSYLWAFLFWFSLSLGCLPLLMLYHLVGGAWGITIRRIIESGTRTIPLMAIFFIPVLLGIHNLYGWSHADKVASDEILQQKHLYLNVPFWIARAVLYFGIWWFYSHRFNALSAAQDTTGDERLVKRFQKLSGPGLVFYGLTITFAVFDWAMSLEPHWYSTIYGMMWIVSQALSALAFSIAIIALVSERSSLLRMARPDNMHDLGNLLLAFVMLWAYLAFSQFLIIWSGNLPEEIQWYLSRINHGWQWIAATLLVFHFFVPFFLLLSRFRKRRIRSLTIIAILVLVMRVVDTFWLVTPAFYGERLTIHWLDVFALVGIGGIWLALYSRELIAMPLIPLHDPNAAPHKAI